MNTKQKQDLAKLLKKKQSGISTLEVIEYGMRPTVRKLGERVKKELSSVENSIKDVKNYVDTTAENLQSSFIDSTKTFLTEKDVKSAIKDFANKSDISGLREALELKMLRTKLTTDDSIKKTANSVRATLDKSIEGNRQQNEESVKELMKLWQDVKQINESKFDKYDKQALELVDKIEKIPTVEVKGSKYIQVDKEVTNNKVTYTVSSKQLEKLVNNPVPYILSAPGGGSSSSSSSTWGSITGDITDQTDLIEYIDTHGGGASIWGGITGTLSDQTDLQTALNGKAALVHTHTASDITDFDAEVSNNTDVAANTAARHTHSNLALLETYTQTEANLADAVAKKHDAATVLDSSNIDFTLTGQQITADLINTTVTPGSYTFSSITVDAKGRITAASNGTVPGDFIQSIADTSTVDLSISGNQLTASVIPSGLNLQDLGGAVTDAQVPNTITLDNITQITNRSLDDITQGLISRKLIVVDLVYAEDETILSGEQTIDGVLTSNSRVLVTSQYSDYTTNGIYISGPGAWTRATDFDSANEIENSMIQVKFGDTFAGSGWQCITNPITLGVTEIFFERPWRFMGLQAGGGAVTLNYDNYGIYAQFSAASVTHNQLGSLQGGTTGQHYHLTAAQQASLGSIDSWVTLASQPALSTNGFAVYAGRNAIFSANGNNVTTFYKFLLTTGAWSTVAAAPAAFGAGSAAVWTGGKYTYAFRGNTTTAFYRYDSSADTWATMAVAPGNIVAGATLVYTGGDHIYATKGGSTTVYRYSISGDAWVTMPGVTPANFGDGSSGVYPGFGDIIYYARANNTTTVYEYSISKDTWATGVAMPNSGGLGCSLAWDGQEFIYATTGGVSGAAFNRFSLALRTWEPMTSPPSAPAGGASLVWANNSLYLTECNGADPAFYQYFPSRPNRISNYGNRGDWYRAVTSAQFNKVNNTLTDITGLSAQVLAGRTYRFEAKLFTTSNVLYGVQAAIAGTCTATAIRYEGMTIDAGVTTQTRAAALATAVGGLNAVTNAYIVITGVITVNAAGTLTVQFAQNTTNAGAQSSVLTLSSFVVTELNT